MYLISDEDFKLIREEFAPEDIEEFVPKDTGVINITVQRLQYLLNLFFDLTNIDKNSDIGMYTTVESDLHTMLSHMQLFDVTFDIGDINANIGVGDSDVITHSNRSVSKRVLPFTKEKPIIGLHLKWGIQNLLEEFPGLENVKNFTYKIGIVSDTCAGKLRRDTHEYTFGNKMCKIYG